MAEIHKYISIIHPYRRGTGCGFGEVRYRPGGTCGPRIQSVYQLVVILKGRSRLRWDGVWYSLPERHAVLLTPGHDEWFEFSRKYETHHTWVNWSPEHLPREMTRRIPPVPTVLPLSPSVDSLMKSALQRHGPTPRALGHLGLSVLEEFLGAIGHTSNLPRIPPPLEKALACMEHRTEEPLALTDIARVSGVTSPHLVKLFRQHLQTTPMKYLWQLRTARGRDSLLATGLSVSEIAHRCGFQNAFHFSRLVKTRYGLAPRDLRNHHWKKSPT
jgi:AraC family transcriptional regulator, arabinose operon regulatory protein